MNQLPRWLRTRRRLGRKALVSAGLSTINLKQSDQADLLAPIRQRVSGVISLPKNQKGRPKGRRGLIHKKVQNSRGARLVERVRGNPGLTRERKVPPLGICNFGKGALWSPLQAGSWPPVQPGLHRRSRPKPCDNPLKKPYLTTASSMYWLQVG